MPLKNAKKWKRYLESDKTFGSSLTDLFKVFDCLHYEILIAKVNTYGFSLISLILINSWLFVT